MFLIMALLSHLSVSLAQRSTLGSCQFSRDCQTHAPCQNIADASCVCNFGQCVISGNAFFRGSECDKYTDCACRGDPASCFCRDGFCQEAKWECHKATDCNQLNKCRGRNCACSGNLCESDCAVDSDCNDFHCNKALGYMCKCEKSLCAYKKKATECNSIKDCVRQGKCQAAKPCACTQSYCSLPWWVAERDQSANCRTKQDCQDTILHCQGGRCSCQDMKPVNDYEMRGTCKIGQKQKLIVNKQKQRKRKNKQQRRRNNQRQQGRSNGQ